MYLESSLTGCADCCATGVAIVGAATCGIPCIGAA